MFLDAFQLASMNRNSFDIYLMKQCVKKFTMTWWIGTFLYDRKYLYDAINANNEGLKVFSNSWEKNDKFRLRSTEAPKDLWLEFVYFQVNMTFMSEENVV